MLENAVCDNREKPMRKNLPDTGENVTEKNFGNGLKVLMLENDNVSGTIENGYVPSYGETMMVDNQFVNFVNAGNENDTVPEGRPIDEVNYYNVNYSEKRKFSLTLTKL